MFSKTLDNKKTYMYDGEEIVDLGEGIFDSNKAMSKITSLYKISKDLEMRPDLVSHAMYGTDRYTEMVLKYSMINNPFAIEEGDYVFGVSINSVYHPIKDEMAETTGAFDLVKNYHKYIDKSKVPSQRGSDSVATRISESPQEANISKRGDSGLVVKNGKIYFGAVDESIASVDSPIVDCATDGTTLGEFLNATIRNTQ